MFRSVFVSIADAATRTLGGLGNIVEGILSGNLVR
jgi:hypothetical protein